MERHDLHFHESPAVALTLTPVEVGAGAEESPAVEVAGASTMLSAGSNPSQATRMASTGRGGDVHVVVDLTMDSD